MASRIPKLVLAAVIVSSFPLAAAATGCAHEHDRRAPAAYPAPYRPGPAPSPTWRAPSWRERELSAVRLELRALERERAQFHTRHAGHPGKLRKYDRSYAERRAALERRWHELQMVAWR
jgi:hypothetical protein